MKEFKAISQELIRELSLEYEPVGVSLYKEGQTIPRHVSPFEGQVKSYCQALILAGKGQSLLLKKDQMGCKLGTAALGLEENPSDYLDDGVLEKYGVGLFGSEAASAATVLGAACLEKGSTRSILIAPLSNFQDTPQVVVFTANSEQVMWLLYAVNYEKGGKMDLPQSGGALGGCSDITVWPLLKGLPNITFLGLGCRLKSAIGAGHLMMGVPGTLLEALHIHIRDLAKPISMLKSAAK